ncbi:hypothetical protein CI687_26305 [Shigella boydii]|nr:hypothetical protein CI687_26305 [Shigella boydii]
MGKIAGKIFLTSKKHHSNQSPAASSRCLQGTPLSHFTPLQFTSQHQQYQAFQQKPHLHSVQLPS